MTILQFPGCIRHALLSSNSNCSVQESHCAPTKFNFINSTPAADALGPDGKRLSLTALAVDAARARATLGEISSALEAAWGRHEAATSVSAGAYISEKGGAKAEAEVCGVCGLVVGVLGTAFCAHRRLRS